MTTDYIDYAGYTGCVRLENEQARVVLGPHCGGRVLEYAWHGRNALMLDPRHNGWEYDRDKGQPPPLGPSGGRFDIGPQHIVPEHSDLWLGKWRAEIVDTRAARMTSLESQAAGTQLVREFSLAADSGHLVCTQTMKNVSDHETRWCYWSRTFGGGHGICIVPLTPSLSRFPKQYVMYDSRTVINFAPDDPAIRVHNGFLLVLDTPARPKLGLDSFAGWLAYLMTNDLLFVKRFPTYPDRVYNEVAALTIVLWYYGDVVCELEALGPMEVLAPGESSSFTEEWWLVPYPFPVKRDSVDLVLAETAQQVMQP